MPSPPARGELDATLEELAYLREELARVLPGSTSVRPLGFTAGLRPLVRAEGDPGELSREHAILEEHGVFVIAGGKYTTFRVMAADVLARVLRKLGYPDRRDGAGEPPLPAPPADDVALEKRVTWAVEHAFARRLEDVIRRRSRLWLEPDHARHAAPRIAALMAARLDWSPERERRELADWELAMHESERMIDRTVGAIPAGRIS